MNFSPEVIDDYLGRNKLNESDEVPSLTKFLEFAANQMKEWQRKDLLSTSKLSVKYVVHYRISAFN